MINLFIIICVVVTTVDFYIFFLIGRSSVPSSPINCELPKPPASVLDEAKEMAVEDLDLPPCEETIANTPDILTTGAGAGGSAAALAPVQAGRCYGWSDAHLPYMRAIDSDAFSKYKGDHLVDLRYVPNSVLVQQHENSTCRVVAAPLITTKGSACSGIIRMKDIPASLHLMRYDSDEKYGGVLADTNHYMPTGFFRKASNVNGRLRIGMKMNPLIKHLHDVDKTLLKVLTSHGHMPGTNSDLIVMVVNDGELDLFMNFVCSCKAHGISLEKVLVMCGSGEIVPLIDVTGAMGYYHPSFAAVSREASNIYLDRTFVDMMWYKAFSVWLVLRLKYNVLFQDVDLVWFRDPWQYLHSYKSPVGVEVDTFWSDDGQRGLRYSPYYGNSGFYYIRWNERTEYWAWSLITAFDTMHTSGSHQNVVTTRLMESMDLCNVTVKILSVDEFPTGMKYHHDKPYMQALSKGTIKPYNFHMCWTSNKQDKIKYFKNTGMWYLRDTCEVEGAVIPSGDVFQVVMATRGGREEKYQRLTSDCCTIMNNAPPYHLGLQKK